MVTESAMRALLLLGLLFSVIVAITDATTTLSSGIPNIKQTIRLEYAIGEIRRCTMNKEVLNLVQTIHDLCVCITHETSHCVMDKAMNFISEKNNDYQKLKHKYCGLISSSGKHSSTSRYVLEVIMFKNFLQNLKFNQFYFEWQRSECQQHSVMLTDSTKNINKLFCGKRRPWTMIIANNVFVIHVTTSAFRKYELVLFYSIYKVQWLDHFIQEAMMFNNLTTYSILPLYSHHVTNQPSIKYLYILADPWQRIVIYISWNVLSESDMILQIHDGPGRLSNYLAIFDKESPNNKYSVTTAAYVGFIQMSRPRDDNVKLKISVISGMSNFPECVIKGRTIDVSSRGQDNTVCLGRHRSNGAYLEGVSGLTSYAGIYIESFTFNGPHIIFDEGPYNCQYGGMYISHLLEAPHKMIPFCESRHHFYLYSRFLRISILIVFYAGYVSGAIKTHFVNNPCLTNYLELTDYPGYFLDQLSTFDDSVICRSVVCAPKEHERQSGCHVSFNSTNVGFATTEVLVATTNAIHRCIAEFYKNVSTDTFNMTLLMSKRWPLGRSNVNTIYGTLEASHPFRQVFLYLYNVSISLHGQCSKQRQKQMLFMMKSSSCQQTNHGQLHVTNVGFIPAVSAKCFNANLVIKHYLYTNSSHLIYKEGPGAHKGGQIKTSYRQSCHAKCRRYTFMLLVLKRREDRIYVYTMNVGEYISTGYSHNGFRLTVLPPSPNCKCDIWVQMVHFQYAIGQHFQKPIPVAWSSSRGDLYSKR